MKAMGIIYGIALIIGLLIVASMGSAMLIYRKSIGEAWGNVKSTWNNLQLGLWKLTGGVFGASDLPPVVSAANPMMVSWDIGSIYMHTLGSSQNPPYSISSGENAFLRSVQNQYNEAINKGENPATTISVLPGDITMVNALIYAVDFENLITIGTHSGSSF